MVIKSNIPVINKSLDEFETRSLKTEVLFHVLPVFFFVPFCAFLALFRFEALLDTLRKSNERPIKSLPYYQDEKLIEEVKKLPQVRRYIDSGLEFQKMEGYCASATMRCVLRSIQHQLNNQKKGDEQKKPNESELDDQPFPAKTISQINIPGMVRAPSVPPVVCAKIDAASDNKLTKSTVIYGSEGYESFINGLKLSNQSKYRVAINFLRSPLNNFLPWKYYPLNFMMGFMNGHFSVVLAYLEDKDLVCLFDVNHKMGGICFIPSRRLYDAVNTIDITVGRRTTRGLVVTEILNL